MTFKSAALALANVALPPTPYTCPVTGEQAYLKRFTVAEREAYGNAVLGAPKNKSNAVAFVKIMCDKDGKLLFSDDDVDAVLKMPAELVDKAIEAFSKPPATIEQAEKN